MIREDALTIIKSSIEQVLPEPMVRKALAGKQAHMSKGKTIVIAIGKAAWNMAHAAAEVLGNNIDSGLIITKYEHSKGALAGFEIIEAGHPVPDNNSILGAEKAISLVSGLSETDEVILLLSGGGSALFEKPLDGIMLDDVESLTTQLLRSGADIVEINTVRKHLSAVKGGRFAEICKPAHVLTIVLSDVLGDKLDSIASGPQCADISTSEEASCVLKKYNIKTSDIINDALCLETPKQIDNSDSVIVGSVGHLCSAAAEAARKLGYIPYILSDCITAEARDVGKLFAQIAQKVQSGSSGFETPCAIIAGGETVVKVTGTGRGGRNQELALSAAIELADTKNTVIFSVGSDGTDGPTDAAGGMVDGKTLERLNLSNVDAKTSLDNNDAYHALKQSNDLIYLGATGTNVNDLMVILMK